MSTLEKVEELACPRCRQPLSAEDVQLSCAACRADWPIRNGIPRFFTPDYYWGEISKTEAEMFLRDSEERGWRTACQRRFSDEPDMLTSLLDPQRTSWLPLLALPENSVALDVGCGYGAITQGIARVAGEVYSVEAVTERLEFTRIRLQQEGIRNVRLFQATALDLPFADRLFDVIVVNGILEWVGEWERNGNPRSIQAKFLNSLYGMLKANGKLVIGIENRFGYGLFRGGMDHSGIPYTSLMPRWLASQYLRIDKTPHHRMQLNPKREYRTYTYGKRGYKKLLAESGFSSSTFYWADPGYNQPYTLIPVVGSLVRQHFRKKQYGLHSRRRGWRRIAANLLACVLPSVVPDFLIIAQKSSAADGGIMKAIAESREQENSQCCLYTNPFSVKTVIHTFGTPSEKVRLIVKACNGTRAEATTVEAEHAVLSLVHKKLSKNRTTWGVPVPGPQRRIGKNIFVTESVAAGQQLSRFFSGHSHSQPGRIAQELEKCVDVATDLAYLLRGERAIPHVEPDYWRVPSGIQHETLLQSLVDQNRLRNRSGWSYVQHGDFTIENIFLDSATGRITIVDWEHATAGVTPLYDTLSLLMSALPLLSEWRKGTSSAPSSLQQNFENAFFGQGPWADLFNHLLSHACKKLGVPDNETGEHLLEFLVLRINLFASKSAEMQTEHLGFLSTAIHRQEGLLISSQRLASLA